jgi:hypothetical protein
MDIPLRMNSFSAAHVHLVFERCTCLEKLVIKIDDEHAIETVLNRVEWLRVPASVRSLEVAGMSVYCWADWHQLCKQLASLTLTANWADTGEHLMTEEECDAFEEAVAELHEAHPTVAVKGEPKF